MEELGKVSKEEQKAFKNHYHNIYRAFEVLFSKEAPHQQRLQQFQSIPKTVTDKRR